MAKIGTAHVEVKTVINDESLATLAERIRDAVAEGVEAGIRQAQRKVSVVMVNAGPPLDSATIGEGGLVVKGDEA